MPAGRLLRTRGTREMTAALERVVAQIKAAEERKTVCNRELEGLVSAGAAEVRDKLFHDLRRTAARNMERAGVPECVAANELIRATRCCVRIVPELLVTIDHQQAQRNRAGASKRLRLLPMVSDGAP